MTLPFALLPFHFLSTFGRDFGMLMAIRLSF